MKNRLLSKGLALFVMLALLMLGLYQIQDVVQDRIRNREHAVQSVVASLAGQQTLMGPVLVQTCTRQTTVQNDKKTETSTKTFQRMLLPDELRHEASAHMEELARGLHKVNSYVLKDNISASFSNAAKYLEPVISKRAGSTTHMSCEPFRIALALGDARGVRSARILAGQKELSAEPSTGLERYTQGISAPLPLELIKKGTPLELSVQLELVGTERLAFVPLGSQTQVSLSADWPHPSFGGSFLPTRREISEQGFSASWNLSALASSAMLAFHEQAPLCPAGRDQESYYDSGASKDCLETLTTDFLDPVNPYSLSDRATKYGLLFIALTFVAVAMFEVLKKLRVHPVQYLFVGSALCSFFLLLISLSEHLGFASAYAVAAVACVSLLAYYASHILGSFRLGLPFAAGIAALYALLYVLLQLEQTALVVGALALFAVLALLMVCTRKVDWYAFGSETAKTAPKAIAEKAPQS